MLDLTVAYNKYQFVGAEYLTWAWWATEMEPDAIARAIPGIDFLRAGDRITLERVNGDETERIVITGEDANLDEARMALAKGSLVTELSLVLGKDNRQWSFTLKSDELALHQLHCPDVPAGKISEEDLEGALLDCIYQQDKAAEFVDALFNRFILLRLDVQWPEIVSRMRRWAEA